MKTTMTIDHGTTMRFLPGDQRFILWYGLAIGMLVPVPSTTGWITDVKTPDERVWMLRKPVRMEHIGVVLEDAEIETSNGDCLMASNPWCPKGLEDAWRESAQRRHEERRTR